MEEVTTNVDVIWRATKLKVELNSRWTFEELGKKLVQLTNVKPDTLKLLVPQINGKRSRLVAPFSDDNSGLDIRETGITKGKPVRMLGVFDDEINDVSQSNMRPDLRIAGFEEEERRLRQLSSYKPHVSLKLPQGLYIFSDFRTLDLPGIKLNPPSSKTLRIMHILACDPGIIAVMNKHRWRVGVMTELAPVGYVGISPKCILGFNKNHGEEISLRLRTDDLKGFRKYESIKKTLLHELAHMVYSEHDSKFLALEKQLNEEAARLDWTKSRSRTLSGLKVSNHYEDEVGLLLEDVTDTGHVLGGSNQFGTARASSIVAAFDRYASSLSQDKNDTVPDLDDLSMIDEDGESPVVLETNGSSIIQIHTGDFVEIESEPDVDEEKVDSLQSVGQVERDSSSFVDVGLAEAEPESNVHMSDSDNMELRRIEESVSAVTSRIQESINFLKSELPPHMSASVLQTLSKIIRNVIDHPHELKFRRIKKANPQFQRNVANYKAALQVLTTVGFREDVEVDEVGEAQTYLVLKRNDPGLLWLAKSSIEPFIA